MAHLHVLIVFQIGLEIHFYILKQIEDIFFLLQLESIKVPICCIDFPFVETNINALYNIVHAYDSFCQQSSESIEKDNIPVLTYAAFENIYKLDDFKKQKRTNHTSSGES